MNISNELFGLTETPKKRPWLIRMHHRMRTASFALLFVATSLHISGKDYSIAAWMFFGTLFLIYPHVQYWRAYKAENPVNAEIANLRVDSFLLGIAVSALAFPLWLTFSALLGALTNSAANKGWRGVIETVCALFGGALLWIAAFGFKLSTDTDWQTTSFCIAGITWYLLAVHNLEFSRNAQLRLTREKLQLRENQLIESRAELEIRVEQETRSKNQHRQFIAILTHELRTPLAVIDSAVQSLEHLQQTPNDDIRLRHQRIRRSVGRINGLVKQFLANDRIDDTRLSAHQVQLDAADLARLSLQSCAEDADRVLLQAAERVPCWGDAALVQLALVNLLDNALKYSPPDSPIEFQVEAMAHQGKSGVAWIVADQGTGIAPENREEVFGKYVRGADHGNVAGVGLGLYFVRRIAELHSGSVEILDCEGYGAVLRFWLPNKEETICSA